VLALVLDQRTSQGAPEKEGSRSRESRSGVGRRRFGVIRRMLNPPWHSGEAGFSAKTVRFYRIKYTTFLYAMRFYWRITHFRDPRFHQVDPHELRAAEPVNPRGDWDYEVAEAVMAMVDVTGPHISAARSFAGFRRFR
jgi:hypothetical protein